MTAIDTKAVAYERALRALRLIQEAQNTLDRAAQELSGLIHGATACDKVWRLREQVHRGWYAVQREIERKQSKIDLDEMARATAEREAKAVAK